MKEVGYEPKPGESDEQRTLRARRVRSAWDTTPAIRRHWRRRARLRTRLWRIRHRWITKSPGLRSSLAALNGDAAFYDRVMAALKNPKSPEEYYVYLFTLAAVRRSEAAAADAGLCDFS